jgi:hypothetical protein
MQTNSSVRNYLYKVVASTFFVFSLIVFNCMTANAQGMTTTVDDITDNPNQFIGKTVTVTAEVEEVLSSQIVVIEDDEIFQEEMLVLSASPISSIVLSPVKENDDSTFTGVVRIFNANELHEELGLNFDEKQIKKYSGKPVLILSPQTTVSTAVIEEKTEVETTKVEQEPEPEPEKQETAEVIETPAPQPEEKPAEMTEQPVEAPVVAPEQPAKTKRARLSKD